MVSFTSITRGAFLVSTMMFSLASATPDDILQDIANAVETRPNSLQGLDLDLSADAPPFIAFANSSDVVLASLDQIKEYTSLAGIASTAYCRGVVPNGSWTCKNCLEFIPDGQLLTTFGSLISDTSGLLVKSEAQKTFHLVFRGTNSIRQTLTDLVFLQQDYPPVPEAKVHAGFYSSYKENLDQYLFLLQEQFTLNPDYQIVISGHSLGGAQALLAGLNLYQVDRRFTPENMKIFTVGCPRVGNPEFAHYVDSTKIPFFRSVHQRDIVPHLPPQILGYLHAGVESWIVSPEEIRTCISNIEMESCSNSIVPFTSLLDHMTYYDLNEGLCL